MIERYAYEPGDGSRFDLLFGETQAAGFLLIWLRRGGSGGCCLRWSRGLTIGRGYLAEKMAITNHQAPAALIEFLAGQGIEVAR